MNVLEFEWLIDYEIFLISIKRNVWRLVGRIFILKIIIFLSSIVLYVCRLVENLFFGKRVFKG